MNETQETIGVILLTVVPIILLFYYGFKSSYPFDLMDLLRRLKLWLSNRIKKSK